jgi:dynein light chain Tctex-type 1
MGDKDELYFDKEEAETIIKDIIIQVLGDSEYKGGEQATKWANSLIESCYKGLVKNGNQYPGLLNLNKAFKYVATCIIMQKAGAGLTTTTATHWDKEHDDFCKVKWENTTMTVLVTVYACALNLDDPDLEKE